MSLLWYEDDEVTRGDIRRISHGMQRAADQMHLDLKEVAYVAGVAHREQQYAAARMTDELTHVSGGIDTLVGMMLAVAGEELPAIRRILARSVAQAEATNERLASIERHLASPASTAGLELRQRGLFALQNSWWADAVRDLREASERSPYDPLIWSSLGAALTELGQHGDAACAYERGARYALPVSLPVAAGLALLTFAGFELSGAPSRAGAVVNEVLARVDNCPPLLLAKAQVDHDQTALTRALELEPALVVEAAYCGLGVDSAAAIAREHYLQAYELLAHAIDSAARVCADFRLKDLSPRTSVIEADSEPARLIATAAAVDRLRAGALHACDMLTEARETGAVARPAPFLKHVPTPPAAPVRPGFLVGKRRADFEAAESRYRERLTQYEYEKKLEDRREAKHADDVRRSQHAEKLAQRVDEAVAGLQTAFRRTQQVALVQPVVP